MPLIQSANRTRPLSFYDGPDYTPETIGGWVATRDLPWNTIGEALKNTEGNGNTVDHLMTAEEALRAANLDFDVKKVQVADTETGTPIPKLFSTYMDDAEQPGGRFYFAGVSDRYETVRPSRALSTFDAVVEGVDGAHYSAVWSMREKSQMGVTIEFPDRIIIDPKGAADEVGLFGLGWNSFDGSTGLGFGASAARFWCMNQFNPTLRGVKRGITLRHTRNVSSAESVRRAKEAIGVTMNWAKAFDEMANNLFALRMSDAALQTMLNKLEPFAEDGADSDAVAATKKGRTEMVLAAWDAPHNENIRGTAWGAFNVVSEWADWGRRVLGSLRTGTTPTRQRAVGCLVHPSVSGLKQKAWDLVTADVG